MVLLPTYQPINALPMVKSKLYPDSLRIRVPSCQTARSGFYRSDDTARLLGHGIAARPDRAGSGWVGRAPPGPAGKCAGLVGRWDELRGGRQGLAAGRRHDPHLAPAV